MLYIINYTIFGKYILYFFIHKVNIIQTYSTYYFYEYILYVEKGGLCMYCRRDMIQPNNPTDEERHDLLKYVLSQYNRLIDYPYIIKGMSPPNDVLSIAKLGSMKGMKICIMGAGIAGLTAAYELRKLGAHIDILDASKNHVGGKIHTYYFDQNNYGELGPMRIPISHECIWRYINIFNLDTLPFMLTNPNGFIYVKNTRVRNDPYGENVKKYIYPLYDLTPNEKEMSWQDLLLKGLMEPLNHLTPEVRQEILYQLEDYSPNIKYWLKMSAVETMDVMGLSKGAIDMLTGLSFILGGFPNSGYSEVFQENYTGDFEYVYQIKGGTSNLSKALYMSLCSKTPTTYAINNDFLGSVDFHMSCIVKGITYNKDNENLSVAVNKYGYDTTMEYDYAICCLPYSKVSILDFNPLLTNNRSWGVREIAYKDIQKTLLYCKKRFWLDEDIHIQNASSITDLSIQTIWYPQDGVTNPDTKGVLLATYNIGLSANRVGNMSDTRRVELIKRQLEAVHGLRNAYLDSIVIGYETYNWKDMEWYQGICFYDPEQKYRFSSGIIATEYDNHLQFSGVHTSSVHGWMQGAVKSSLEAVNKIASSLY